MNAMTATMEAAISADLETEFPSAAAPAKRRTPEEQVEHLAAVHRKGEEVYRQRAADTRRNMKVRIAAYKADERAEIARHAEAVVSETARHAEALTFIAERSAEVKDDGNRDAGHFDRLANYNRNAVADLAAE